MFKFCSLFSGSSGNCLLVESEDSKVLIDAGGSAKKIVDALSLVGVKPEDLKAIVVTHEHSDHVKSLGTLSKKFNIPVFANTETWDAMPEQKEKILVENQKTFIVNKDFEIADLKFSPFNIPHDAANPCGFNIFHDNQKISIATDLGHITPEIMSHLEKSCFALLESNYDLNVLKCSRYPYALKQRIAGPLGHLSNDTSGKVISKLVDSGLKNVLLGHLSKENNFPELAYKTVAEEVLTNRNNESDIHIGVARRDCPSSVIDIA